MDYKKFIPMLEEYAKKRYLHFEVVEDNYEGEDKLLLIVYSDEAHENEREHFVYDERNCNIMFREMSLEKRYREPLNLLVDSSILPDGGLKQEAEKVLDAKLKAFELFKEVFIDNELSLTSFFSENEVADIKRAFQIEYNKEA